MDRRDSPLSKGAKIKLIASVIAEKNAYKVGKAMKQYIFFFYEQRRWEIQTQGMKYY